MPAHELYSTRHRRLQSWRLQGLGLMFGLLGLVACKASETEASVAAAQGVTGVPDKPERARMWMTVGKRRFAVTLADTEAARAFAAQLPLTLDMAELNGNEKHAELPQPLPSDASRPGTIRNGDVMLYGSKTLVVFYETFQSSYSYTRLGRVNDPRDLSQALGGGNARVSFTRE
jgi:hypothetical protein